MIVATFSSRGEKWTAFTICGHAGFARAGRDIVCAAVTSGVELTANTLTDVLHVPARVEVGKDRVAFEMNEPDDRAVPLIEGLYRHLRLIAEQYPECVRVVRAKGTRD